MVAFLALELHKLPSEILAEDYNLIANVLSFTQCKAERQEKEERKHKKRF